MWDALCGGLAGVLGCERDCGVPRAPAWNAGEVTAGVGPSGPSACKGRYTVWEMV